MRVARRPTLAYWGTPTDRMYSFASGRNPFVLSEVQRRPNPSLRQLQSLARLPQTPALEKAFTPFVAEMPQLALRGHAEGSRPSYYSFLVSSTPIEGLLSEAETQPPLFFQKLYASVAQAIGCGMSHWDYIQDSQALLLSLFPPVANQRITERSMFTYSGAAPLILPGVPDVSTFPITSYGRGELGFLYFEKADILAGLNTDPWRASLRRNAVIYSVMLELMLSLAHNDWQPDSRAVS